MSRTFFGTVTQKLQPGMPMLQTGCPSDTLPSLSRKTNTITQCATGSPLPLPWVLYWLWQPICVRWKRSSRMVWKSWAIPAGAALIWYQHPPSRFRSVMALCMLTVMTMVRESWHGIGKSLFYGTGMLSPQMGFAGEYEIMKKAAILQSFFIEVL